jgi:hypothetical protein
LLQLLHRPAGAQESHREVMEVEIGDLRFLDVR